MSSSRTTVIDRSLSGPCCALARFHASDQVVRARRYPSDMTDAEWAAVEAALPVPAWLAGNGGRPEKHCRRVMIDAIRYLVDNGIKWRALPVDFPNWSAVHGFFTRFAACLHLRELHDRLRARVRIADGRDPQPSAAIIDSQSVKAAETVGRDDRGFDGGKNVNGRKRHIIVDTLGMLLLVLVTPANANDRAVLDPMLRVLRRRFPLVGLIWADGGYPGPAVAWAHDKLQLIVQIVKRTDDIKGFKVLPRRWAVERTFAWIMHRRRCVRDYERLDAHHEAMVTWAMTILMTRRLSRRST